MATMAAAYPIRVRIDPAAPQRRLTVLFRLLLFIPHLILLYVLGIVMAVVIIIAWFAILLTGSYPRSMYGFAVNFLRWLTRTYGYLCLLTDKYPPRSWEDDATYPIRLAVDERTTGRNRLTVFFRVLMMIPHLIVLGVLGFVAEVLLVVAWLVALFTGSVPAGIHNYVAGVMRWWIRLLGYYYLLLCDEYPPFSMD